MSAVKHIAILCSRLDLPGGIERAIVNTSNLFAAKGHFVTLVILDETDKSFYPLHSSVHIIQQSLTFGITSGSNIISRKIILFNDVLRLRKIIKNLKADFVISTEYPFSVAGVLAGIKKYSRLFAWEHHHFAWLKKNRFWTFLCNQCYPKLNGIICLNKEEQQHYKKIAPAFIIPNFVDNSNGTISSGNSKTILSVGWLIPRKGIDLMLKAARQVLTDHPGWIWKLIGEGEMKEEVLRFVKEEKLEKRFVLQSPVSSTITEEYLNASLFVLSSRFEAFPMVLLEAMSFGVPCVSFNCPSGPADIITHNEDGLLVEKENPQKLTEAITILVENEEGRKKMGEKAFANVQRFSPEKIYELWKQLF